MTTQSEHTATALPQGLTPSTWSIDPSHTEAAFSVRHAGISKVRGGFADVTGTVVVGDTLEGSSVTATMPTRTISTGDAKRDEHLRSADFFDVDTYPELTFASTAVRATGDGYEIDGDLSLHGVTKPVTLTTDFNGTATDPFGNARVGFSATTQISRKDFGLTWNAALETGGVLVGDKISITLDVSAIKQD